jgi:hypothetical protein
MKGAKEYYNIIKKAHLHNVGGLLKLNLKHGWNGGDSEAFLYNNFVFVTSTHARGKCLHIYLTDQFDPEEIKNTAFEVFGVTTGLPGWTEEYDWLHDGEGNWVRPIIQYLGKLQSEADSLDHENMIKRSEEKKVERQLLNEKVNKFNKMFA